MQIINLNNVEEIIFYNEKAKKALPEFKEYFNQWMFYKKNSGFRQLIKRTLSDFLSSLKTEHIDIISKALGGKIQIDTLDYHTVYNETYNVDDDIELLLNHEGYYFDIWRDKEQIFVTFWR